MKIEECWVADRDRWKEDEGGLAARAAPNAQRQSTLTLTLTLARERRGGSCCSLLRRLAAAAAASSSLVLVCAHPLVLSLSLSRSSTLSLSQCCTLNSLLQITIACLDSLNQSIDILLLLLLWSADIFVAAVRVLQS